MRIEREAGARAPSREFLTHRMCRLCDARRTHELVARVALAARVALVARFTLVARVACSSECDAARGRRARPEGMEA